MGQPDPRRWPALLTGTTQGRPIGRPSSHPKGSDMNEYRVTLTPGGNLEPITVDVWADSETQAGVRAMQAAADYLESDGRTISAMATRIHVERI